MIIAFEGMSCVGKTTTIGRLNNSRTNCNLINEMIFQIDPFGFKKEVFGLGDEIKSRLIELGCRPHTLLDRYYIATFLCQGRYRQDTILEDLARHSEGLIEPDLWVYIRMDPVESFQRYKKWRAVDGLDPWANLDNVKRIYSGYEKIFSELNNSLIFGCADQAYEYLLQKLS